MLPLAKLKPRAKGKKGRAGPAGPAGPAGAKGATGPAGPAGTAAEDMSGLVSGHRGSVFISNSKVTTNSIIGVTPREAISFPFPNPASAVVWVETANGGFTIRWGTTGTNHEIYYWFNWYIIRY